VSHDEQLAWEARAGKPAGVAAFAAAFMAVAAGLYIPLAVGDIDDGAYGYLKTVDAESSDFLIQSIVQGLALLLLVPPLLYLFRATRNRRSQLMPAAAVLLALGAITVAVVAVLGRLEVIDIADRFFPDEAQGVGDLDEAAEDFISDESSAALQGVGLGGTLALAFAIVMISLNAMRAGLLSRFMGILGIFVGVLLIIPLGVQILQLFWFAALGMLFLDRWPGGRGPAWQTGEEIPWPGAAAQREEIERRRAEREGLIEPEPETEPEAGEPRPKSRKRRKK
jgi:ABC-type multidrug transport system fused ATPase/permease subunit